jgi:AGZA family xanthine/uracil permease-like MFS transporter
MLDAVFQLSRQETTVRREVLAGVTTFLTMAYIILVNPTILADAGMDRGAVFVATCLAAALGTLIMGLLANYPIALAPGMGLNAFFTYTVVGQMGYGWQVALGAVFVSGLLFLALSVLPVREWVINAIPRSLKMAISAGIGLFLAIIALKNAGLVVGDPVTLVALGDLTKPSTLLAIVGFIAMVALDRLRVAGSIIIAILGTTVVGISIGVSPFDGVVSAPPSLGPTLLQMDVAGALQVGLISVVFAFLFVDLFDTAGTLVGVAHRAGLLDERGRLPRLRNVLLADSLATVAGAALGTSTTTSYIESAAGIKAGGRTGLTAVVVAVLFMLALFFCASCDHGTGLCDRAGAAVRRLYDDARARRTGLGGRDRIRAGRRHRDRHALHVLDRHRHRIRFRNVCGDEVPERPIRRSRTGGTDPRFGIRSQIFITVIAGKRAASLTINKGD